MTAPPFKAHRGFLPPSKLEFAIGLKIRGTLKDFVYQQVDPRFANAKTLWDKRRQKRRHIVPFDPQTVAQTAQRSKMALAVSAWGALTAVQKAEYSLASKRANYRHRYEGRKPFYSGYHYFLSQHMRGFVPEV